MLARSCVGEKGTTCSGHSDIASGYIVCFLHRPIGDDVDQQRSLYSKVMSPHLGNPGVCGEK